MFPSVQYSRFNTENNDDNNKAIFNKQEIQTILGLVWAF